MSQLATNPKVLGFIDRWCGGTACAVLTVFRKLFGGKEMVTPERRGLLFMKLAEQGSTVLASAAIRDAVQRHGRENVYFFVFQENRFILDALDVIPRENVLTVNTKNAFTMITSALQVVGRIRRMKLAACVDMEFFARSTAVLCYLTGIPIRVGFHAWHAGEGPFRGDLFTRRLRYNPHLHSSVTFRSLVAAVDDRDPDMMPRFDWHADEELLPLPHFQPTPEEVASVRALVAETTSPDRKALVLLNANASDLLPLRRWPNENYLDLARRVLALSEHYYIGFTGGPAEAKKVAGIVAELNHPRVVCFAGRTTLRELLALYNESDVLVTNDSGPAHFAALTSVETVVLFGPETPKLFGTLSPNTQSITAGLACSPCVSALNNRQTNCRDNVCMRRISVDQVFQAVTVALERRQAVSAAA